MSKSVKYEFFRDFFLLEQAEGIVELLKEAKIPFKLDKSETIIDEAIVGNSLTPKIVLRLPKEYFQQANELIKQSLVLSYEDIDNHYLNQLEQKELEAILKKPDEWSVEDVIAAQQILKSRGVDYSDGEVKYLQEKRLKEIRKGKTESLGVMGISYLIVILISSFFSLYFILAGLGIAWYYWKDTTIDATGFKFHSFDATTRKLGRIAFWVWLFVMVPFFLSGLPIILFSMFIKG